MGVSRGGDSTIPRQPQEVVAVDVAVVVAVAGVITVGHGHENGQDHVHDHHRSLPLGAGLDHGKACLFKVVRAVAPLVAVLGGTDYSRIASVIRTRAPAPTGWEVSMMTASPASRP